MFCTVWVAPTELQGPVFQILDCLQIFIQHVFSACVVWTMRCHNWDCFHRSKTFWNKCSSFQCVEWVAPTVTNFTDFWQKLFMCSYFQCVEWVAPTVHLGQFSSIFYTYVLYAHLFSVSNELPQLCTWDRFHCWRLGWVHLSMLGRYEYIGTPNHFCIFISEVIINCFQSDFTYFCWSFHTRFIFLANQSFYGLMDNKEYVQGTV